MKTCRVCSETKPLELFYPNRKVCKSCHAANGKVWKNSNKQQWLGIVAKSKKKSYDKDPSVVLQRNIEWRQENREWVQQYNRQYRIDNPETVALARKLRETSLKQQCPSWADKLAIKAIYQQAKTLGLEVDHIIPLQGKTVCGLHVENNLQLLTRADNRIKSNKYECDNSFGRCLYCTYSQRLVSSC